eukprot:CAMPEP_0197919370 /NCGR_PEP_ID=MMETSP1439-20131203/87130_1 /TAXON_ID=66791 /ORGANISM="Gonyaulax spinifera, Strain CCMP409" /LENGTH=32 /DNA_ID= /DNA_START= /DNA_END= /DNA_ORIENTATION=
MGASALAVLSHTARAPKGAKVGRKQAKPSAAG